MVAPSRCVCYTETDRGHSSTCPTHAGPEKLEEKHLSTCHRHHCNRWVSDREMGRWSPQRRKSMQSKGFTHKEKGRTRDPMAVMSRQIWGEVLAWDAVKGHGSVILLQLESVSISDLIYYQRPSCRQWSGLQRETRCISEGHAIAGVMLIWVVWTATWGHEDIVAHATAGGHIWICS